MRKYILGIAIAAIFVAYSVILRNQHSESVVAPTTLAQNNSTSSSTDTSSNTSPTSTTSPSTSSSSQYKNGTFTGSIDNAFYGNVQVSATIQSGKITAVNFLEYPNENPNSIYVNTTAIPYLKQEAIKAQSSNVSVVTGATYTSQAFVQSLANALSQASQS